MPVVSGNGQLYDLIACYNPRADLLIYEQSSIIVIKHISTHAQSTENVSYIYCYRFYIPPCSRYGDCLLD